MKETKKELKILQERLIKEFPKEQKKKRFWKDKEGNELTFKEFIKKWGEGIEGITPKQKLKSQLIGTKISLIGILLGFFISLYGYKHLWWVAIILLGALINTYIQYISFKQQLKILDEIDKQSLEEK